MKIVKKLFVFVFVFFCVFTVCACAEGNDNEITFNITVSSDIINGSLVVNTNSAKEGEMLTFSATPNEGYELRFIEYSVDGINFLPIEDDTFILPSSDITVRAVFQEIINEITISAYPNILNGTLEFSKNKGASGETVAVTVYPDSGFKLAPNSLRWFYVSDFSENLISNPNEGNRINGLSFTLNNASVIVFAEFAEIRNIIVPPQAHGILETNINSAVRVKKFLLT